MTFDAHIRGDAIEAARDATHSLQSSPADREPLAEHLARGVLRTDNASADRVRDSPRMLVVLCVLASV